MEYQKYAVIDIGSNSLRLMTGWQEVPGTWTFSPKELATTQLGKGIDETRHLSADGMEASFAAMEGWKKKLSGVPVCAVATSAVREAVDGQAFLAEVRARFGWHCRAISGLEEASLCLRERRSSSIPRRRRPSSILAAAAVKSPSVNEGFYAGLTVMPWAPYGLRRRLSSGKTTSFIWKTAVTRCGSPFP